MAVALFLGGLATDGTDSVSAAYAPVNELVGLAAIGALWWRRRWPIPVAALTFVASAAAPMAGGAAIVGVYSVAAEHRGRWASAATSALYVAYLVCGSVSVVVFRDEDLGVVGGALAAAVLSIAAHGWGLAVRSRRDLLAALAERAERAEADQHARMVEARRAERARIAAEMHDVLAHRLSLLSIHAGAIELRIDAPRGELAEAARVVRSNAHLALDDLRTVIGVLHDGHGAALAPQPTLGDLAALVAECRAAGMEVAVSDALADRGAVPAEVGRHAYRAVREALTNARKHAPGQPVRLCLAGGPGDGLGVEVTNPVAVPVPAAEPIPGAGAGLVGLRERVELAGGTLDQALDGAEHRLLLGGDGLAVVGEAADGAEALRRVEELAPDLVLMDIRMPGVDGLTATEAIRARPGPPEVVVLTTFDADEHVLRALRAGAAGFLLKDTPPAEIVDALHRVVGGDAQLSPPVLRRLIASVATTDPRRDEARRRLATLSERELDVARGIGEGLSNAAIAARLYVSVATVKARVTTVLDKLGAANRVQVALVVHDAERR
jgi:DNA-binding NarL/FixJ family response regulator/signal transduction histidine kinase